MIEYALRRGSPHDQRSQLRPKTTTRTLFSTATQENLSLLVVLKDDELQSLHVGDLIFAHCITDRNDPVPSGCTIDEAELNGLFFNLIDNGYSGLAFIQGGAFIGIEWKDLMLPPTK